MPKMKTKKAVLSRFKVTGSGKLLRHRPNRHHKLEKKSSHAKRYLASPGLVDATLLKTYKRLMGV